MPTFYIDAKVNSTVSLTIYAESKDEALEIARDALSSNPDTMINLKSSRNITFVESVTDSVQLVDD